MKKILLCVFALCMLISIGFSVFLIKTEVSWLVYIENVISEFTAPGEDLIEARNLYIMKILFLFFIEVVNLVSVGLILYGVLKNPARLTYEEYKKQAETRRLARQEKKRSALEEKQKSIQDELDRMK